MGKPYGYLRKSSVRDMRTELAPETQEREVKALAARFGDAEGLVLRSDWDVSGAGKYTKKRKQYLDMVQAIEDGRCSAVYSYALARLGRSAQELARFFELCAGKGVPVRFVADPAFETGNASGMFTANMMSSVAQFESQVASERQHARNLTKRLRHESLRTRRYYGEGEGEDAGAVLDAFRQTGSYSRAARLLNERGMVARSGKPWWSSSVRVVVQRLDPTVTSSGRGARTVSAFALSRLLVCPTCKHFLTGAALTGRNGRKFRRYACRYGESSPHPRVSVAESKVLPWVVAQMTGYVLPGQDVDETPERKALDEKRARILENYADGLTSKPERDTSLGPVLAALAHLDARRSAVNPSEIDWTASPGDVNRQLRTLVSGIMLDADFLPVKIHMALDRNARWTDGVPEGGPATGPASGQTEPMPDDLRDTVYGDALESLKS